MQARSEEARSEWDAALASKDRLLQQLEEKLEAEQSNCQQLRKALAEAQHREEVASGRAEELAKRAAEAQHWQAKAEVRPRRAAFVRAPGSIQHLSLAPHEAAIRTRAGQTDSCWHEHTYIRVSLALCRPLRWRRMRCSAKWKPYRCPRTKRMLSSSCKISRALQPAASGSLGETLLLQSCAYDTAGHGCPFIHTRSARQAPYLQGQPALAISHSCVTGCVEHCTMGLIPREGEHPCTCHIARLAA